MPHDNAIWISAGEVSGDMRGAELLRAMREIDPTLSFVGMGGPALRAEGFEALLRMEDLSVMGFTEVLGHLPRILGLLSRTKKLLAERRPRAVVCIDAPDFNFRVVKMAHALGIPAYYYISPQLWAWRQGRAKFLRRHAERVICILPFEEDFYRKRDTPATYVGHPLAERLGGPELEGVTPKPKRVGILPGSRTKEVESLAPVFAAAARRLAQADPEIEFMLFPAPGRDRTALARHFEGLPVTMPDEGAAGGDFARYALMKSCRLHMAASGTVTLELALLGCPTIVAYKLSKLTFALGRLLVKVPFISLPNLVLGRKVFPELLQEEANESAIAELARRWLEDEEAWTRTRRELDGLKELLGPSGAARRAAEIILAPRIKKPA